MATGGRDDSRSVDGVLNMGTPVPNRIFVGGITSKTSEEDLRHLFSKYGNVKATKVILDKVGVSKGFGFVTFETEEEAQRILNERKDCIFLKEKKLNIAAAFKKHPFNRCIEPAAIHTTPVVWSSCPYPGSSTIPSREQLYYPQATWPLLWHQQLYVPQHCSYPQMPQQGYSPYLYSVVPPEYQYPNIGHAAGSDNSETSSADDEVGRNRSRASTPAPLDNERNRNSQVKLSSQNSTFHKLNSNVENPTNYVHSSPVPQLHHVLAKTVNGVTLMAYPAPFVMGSPTVLHVKDNMDSENVLSELGYMNSPIASGTLTPPPTPMTPLSCDFNMNASMESLRNHKS